MGHFMTFSTTLLACVARILACVHGLAEVLCRALEHLQMAAALVPEAKLPLLPSFCHLDNVRSVHGFEELRHSAAAMH